MLRMIGGVVVGYLAMAVLVFLAFTGLYLLLGAEGTFKPGTYDVTGQWIAATLAVNVVAALLGGLVSVSVGKSVKSATILSSAVLVLGLVTALMTLNRTETESSPARTEAVGTLHAAQNAREPTWIGFSNPLIGAVGILLGARLKKLP
jgi:hypothetical protein